MAGARLIFSRPAVLLAVVVVTCLVAATVAGSWWFGHPGGARQHPSPRGVAATSNPGPASADELGSGTDASPTPAPMAEPPASSPSAGPTNPPGGLSGSPPPPPPPPPPGPPEHFGTLAPGSKLPSGAQCGSWVQARRFGENKRMNGAQNQATGHGLAGDFFGGSDSRANTQIAPRVDGAFTGTTHEILRWAACKWGIDEDISYAQAAQESWWRQPGKGDWSTDAGRCAPGHGLGVDGRPGECPESFGILQNRYPYERSSWPGIDRSTAMNADTAYAIWRACFEGYERWLNDVERGRQYGAGDAWGCVGRWFSGRWHTAPAEQYIAKVQDYRRTRVWEQPNFQEP